MSNNGSKRSCGLTVLRIVVGIVFVMHGGQKLFSWGVPAVTGFLGSIGVPFPRFFGVVVPLLELFGGAALVLGALTRMAAALLAIDMAVAVLKVHMKHGFFLPDGMEFALTLLAANICLMLEGGGAGSVDAAVWGEKITPKEPAR